MAFMLVMLAVFQFDTLPLKADALEALRCMLPDMPVVVQLDRSWLKAVALLNISKKLVTPRNIPVSQRAVEGCGHAEHLLHVDRVGCIDRPAGQALIEARSRIERLRKVGDFANVPCADRLIERGGATKHVGHVGDVGRVPRADGSVESRRAVKHLLHIGDIGRIPGAYVLIEGRRRLEHVGHCGHGTCIPTADVLVERCAAEHGIHELHIAGVPASDRLVER